MSCLILYCYNINSGIGCGEDSVRKWVNEFQTDKVVDWMGQSWKEAVRHLYGGDETQCTLEAFAEKGTHV